MKLRRWSLAILAAMQLALAFSPAPASAALNCNLILKALSRFKAEPDGPMAKPLFDSPELFFTDHGVRENTLPFYASNEFDWYKTPWDETPTDVLVGFGTNSAWDLAVRKQAKQLVIADWVPGPLIAQRFIHRPLLRAAKTPNEYLLMLAGLEAPPELTNAADLWPLQKYISTELTLIEPQNYREGMSRIHRRLRDAGTAPHEMQAIVAYHGSLLSTPRKGTFGVVRSQHAEDLGNMIGFFMERYLPVNLVKQGASAALVGKPNFSFLSSQAAFDRFKAMYATSLYAHTDYRTRAFYEKLKADGDARGFTKYTFSLTNIFDAANGDQTANSVRDLDAFRAMIYEIFPAPKYDVLIFFTTNYQNPHNFYRLERSTPTPLESWLHDVMPVWMRQLFFLQNGRAG